METFYLSFDVGIINLAYCFAKYDNNVLTIIDWDIINFSKEKIKCNQLLIGKRISRICNKNATYVTKDNTNNYCNEHYKTKNDRVKKIPDPNAFSLYNVEQLIRSLDKLFDDVLTTPYDIKKTNNEQYKFDIKYANNINIIIENQPSTLIQTMKSYSLIIYGYFANKIFNKSKFIKSVRFINASTKTSDIFIQQINQKLNIKCDLFNIYKKKYIDNYENNFIKRNLKNNKLVKKKVKSYDVRKDFSVKLATNLKNLLDMNISNIISSNKFDISKKKDDMADTLLYVYHAIFIGVNNDNKKKNNVII